MGELVDAGAAEQLNPRKRPGWYVQHLLESMYSGSQLGIVEEMVGHMMGIVSTYEPKKAIMPEQNRRDNRGIREYLFVLQLVCARFS